MRTPLTFAILIAAGPVLAAITAPETPAASPAFDIMSADISRTGEKLTFSMAISGDAGTDVPTAVGALAGAPVWSYVWPTSLDPATVGFEDGTGILALASTAHPDFDDTPLYDEDGDGDKNDDGAGWHSHWVVLIPNDACGAGALSVRDIPEGASPKLPATWPGLPLFIDSPDARPLFEGHNISVTLALPSGTDLTAFKFDGVTSALRVNQSVHAPLLCLVDVWDVASGDLSLPGTVE